MAATYQVDVFHGTAPGTASAAPAAGRYHRGDSTPTSDGSTTPIIIPAAGETYSWAKYNKLRVLTAPTGSVSNLRYFTDGVAWGTGVVCYVNKVSAYTQASAANETAKITGGVDATTYTSASPFVINSGTVLTATTGYGTQDFLISQVGVSSTAQPGTTSARTFTYRVDET